MTCMSHMLAKALRAIRRAHEPAYLTHEQFRRSARIKHVDEHMHACHRVLRGAARSWCPRS